MTTATFTDTSKCNPSCNLTDASGEPYTLFATVLATLHVIGVNTICEETMQRIDDRVRALGKIGVALVQPRRGRPRTTHDLDAKFRRNLTLDEVRKFSGLVAGTVTPLTDEQFNASIASWATIDR